MKGMVDMKERYIAPDLCFESFQLSQSIAAGCAAEAVVAVEIWNERGFFLDDTRWTCSRQWTPEFEEQTNEAFCYWNGYGMFTS